MEVEDKNDARFARRSALGAIALTLTLLWACWPVLRALAERWTDDPRYAHGYLVPIFSAVLLWLRRDRLPIGVPNWWGLPLLAAGLALQLGGAYFFYEWFEAVALMPELAGLALLLGGWAALRWSWPAIAFLIFMVPLPYRLEGALSYPLQRAGTLASTYALQTLGLPAIAEGNVIHIDDVSIGVVEACSGLGMLFTFVAMSAGVALLIRRPPLDRVVILLSAAPIAVAVNVLRIATTGVLHKIASHELADRVFHDLAGWLMMPAALGLMATELWLLSCLLVTPAPVEHDPIGLFGRGSQFRVRNAVPRREAEPPPSLTKRPTKAS